MATRAGVGHSTLTTSRDAGREAAAAALAALGEHPADIVVVFSTTGYDQAELLQAVRESCPDARISGCSAEGVIAHDLSAESDHATAIMALSSDSFSFHPFLVEGYDVDSRRAGEVLAEEVAAAGTQDLVCLLLFPDGLTGNCSSFLKAVHARLGIPALIGGAAADALTFDRTYQFLDTRIASGAISGVAIRGPGRVEIAVSHGCSPIGLERTMTRAENGWVYEIDGRPAWSVFKEYLLGDPEDLNAEGVVHLSLGRTMDPVDTNEYSPFIIRTPLSLDKSNGALFFPGGGLETGEPVQLTRRDHGTIKESARSCASSILDRNPGQDPAFVFQFDCAGRGRLLFGKSASEEIVEPLRNTLGAGLPWIGFHTYGEIAPVSGTPYYHNYTVALCAFYDPS